MKIYSVRLDYDNYDACRIDYEACALEHSDIEDYDMMFNMDGSSKKDSWWPRIIKRYNDNPQLGDYTATTSSGETMIIERKAIEKLKPLMGNIEVLPLKCDFGDYWAINVLDVLKCIDYEESEFMLLSDEIQDGRPRIMYFEKYSFKPDAIKGFNIFKIIDAPMSGIFANEVFVNAVKENAITGFEFKLLWER